MEFNIVFILFLSSLFSSYLKIIKCFSPEVEDEFDIHMSLKEPENNKSKRRLRFSAFKRSFDLPLDEMSDTFADNFRLMYTADEPKTGNIMLRETKLKKTPHRGSFYSVDNGIGSVYLEEYDKGVKVEGIVDDDIRIFPLNTKIANSAYSHKAFKISKPIYSSDSFSADYDSPNISDIPYDIYPSPLKDIAYIEVFVLFDYNNSAALNFDSEAIHRYLGIFWNSIQKCFAAIRQPYIRLIINGVLIIKDIKHESFIREHMLNNHQVDGANMLIDFGKWLYKYQSFLPTFDIAFLQTGLDMGLLKNGRFSRSLLGRAYVGTLCNVDQKKKTMWNCGEGEDHAPTFSGILTVSHEVGHLLNSPHDGERTSKSCPDTDGYIMGYENDDYPRRAFYFSPCSVKSIKTFVGQKSPCVWNKPLSRVKLINQFPGTKMTMNDVCIGWFGKGSSAYGEINPREVCAKLWCELPSQELKTRGHPPEGSICGKDLVCIEGSCKYQV